VSLGIEPSGPHRPAVAFVGWGALARTAAGLLADAAVDVVAVAVTDPQRPRPDLPESARVITSPEELAATGATVVAEAAGRASVAPWGRAALRTGADFVVSSTSALTDPGLLDDLRSLANRHRARLQLQPGAVAGIDALAAARPVGLDRVEHRIVKPPSAWQGTEAEQLCCLDGLERPTEFFADSAAVVAARFPRNANVAMTVALAGLGPDATRVTLVADPAATTNRHEIRACGRFGELDLSISNRPLPDNPKSSAMAALGLARAIANRTAGLVI
jgi:aspartate dehydrogenase